MDRPSAKEMIFTNAIYIHRGNQYVVTNLDLENRQCLVASSDVNYFTDSIVKRDIKVLEEDQSEDRAGCKLVVGDVLVRSQVAKFKKLKFQTHENIGYGEIGLPEEQMHTRSVILTFPEGTRSGASIADLDQAQVGPAIARLGTLVRNVAPVFLLCDPRDIGVAERVRDPHFGCPALYVYDQYPGGSGLSEAFVGKVELVMQAAVDLLSGCSCSEGCPSCVGPRDPEEEIDSSPKAAVARFLAGWLGDGGER
jgi:DEAD/DEAH box helicase domain-containing protein